MRKFRRILAMAFALVIVVCGTIPGLAADGHVIYSGGAREFIFSPGSEYSPTDLFTNFKDVMPGDSISQPIYVVNDISKNVKIKVYMRALGAHEDSVDFLSQMNLRVEKVTDTVLFDAPADETAQLTDWVYLGTLYSGGEVELDVILDVPTSLDNHSKDLIGYLDWEFMIEELPVESTDPKPPHTGDDANTWMYVALMVFSGMMIFLLLIKGRRAKKEQQA